MQYILTMVDDMLQEDKTRVEIFRDFARKVHTTAASFTLCSADDQAHDAHMVAQEVSVSV